MTVDTPEIFQQLLQHHAVNDTSSDDLGGVW